MGSNSEPLQEKTLHELLVEVFYRQIQQFY